jgi:hypothetical protein
MSWAKLDDRWDDCPELNDLSADAVALFLRLQARMARLQTDGVLTARDLDVLDQSRPATERQRVGWPALVAELMGRCLLVPERDHWVDVGWFERNPSRDEIEAARAHDAARQRVRYARSNGAGDSRIAELKGEEEEARRALFTARDRRQSAAISQRRLSTVLTTERILRSETEHGSPSAPSHPGPSRPKDEDEDEDRGIAAELREPAAAAPDMDHVACQDYTRHQSHHRLSLEGAWVCDLCARREAARHIRALPDDLKPRAIMAFRRSWGELYQAEPS